MQILCSIGLLISLRHHIDITHHILFQNLLTELALYQSLRQETSGDVAFLT